ncbi:hypothetical protein MO973_38485 [Paenibacillus sp. TRM 82003]|nr:hypothetical protein [Paenibacillus sp. TRM 82003]
MRTLSRTATGVVAAALALVPGSAAAANGAVDDDEPNVRCGWTIIEDVYLTGDLNCPSGDGLVVDAAGVTVHLNGYTISGTRAGTDDAGAPLQVGIRVLAPDVVVRGGTLRGFDAGVLVDPAGDAEADPAPSVEVESAHLIDDGYGVAAVVAGSATVEHSTFREGGYAGAAIEGGAVALDRSSVEGAALLALNGGRVLLDRTLVRGGGSGSAITCSQAFVTVDRSVVSRYDVGANLFQCRGSDVRRSLFLGNTFHIQTERIPDEVVTVSCTAFIGGGPAPDLPHGDCEPPEE